MEEQMQPAYWTSKELSYEEFQGWYEALAAFGGSWPNGGEWQISGLPPITQCIAQSQLDLVITAGLTEEIFGDVVAIAMQIGALYWMQARGALYAHLQISGGPVTGCTITGWNEKQAWIFSTQDG